MGYFLLWLKALLIIPILFTLGRAFARHGSFYFQAPGLLLVLLYICVVSVVSAIALWQLRQGKRGWAVASEILSIPLCFLCIFSAFIEFNEWRKIKNGKAPAPAQDPPRDRIAEVQAAIIGGGFILGAVLLTRYGSAHRLPLPGWLGGFGLLAVAYALNVVVHELGHALAGLSAGFRLFLFQVGPLEWKITDGRWRFQFSGAHATGGRCGMIPLSLTRLRERTAWMVGGGPMASLLLFPMAGLLTFCVVGTWAQSAWFLLGLTSLLAVVLGIANLLPSPNPVEITDGVHLRRLWQGGGWADLLAARSLATTTLHTPSRPRDWDTALLNRAAEFPATPPEQALMLILNYEMYWDRDEPLKALAYLDRAGALIEASGPETRPAFLPLVYPLARVEGFERRNAEQAAKWLALAPDKTRLEWFLAQAAVAYAEQDYGQASASLREASLVAAGLPHAGGYDLDREDVAAYQRLVADAQNPLPVAAAA